MEINHTPEMFAPRPSSRRTGNEIQMKCIDASCVPCKQDSKSRYYCTSSSLPILRQRKVGFEHTPDHPDGLKWHPVFEAVPPRKRLRNLDECPEGRWVNDGC